MRVGCEVESRCEGGSDVRAFVIADENASSGPRLQHRFLDAVFRIVACSGC